MTQVDFYLLPTVVERDRQVFACRLIEKAYKLNHKIYVLCGSDDEIRALDDLLWTFRQGSFVPHARYDTDALPSAPVLVGCSGHPLGVDDLLLNFTTQVPELCGEFHRVAEFIGADALVKRAGRARYKIYRERGYSLATHPIANLRVVED